jgi:hypothetical protein
MLFIHRAARPFKKNRNDIDAGIRTAVNVFTSAVQRSPGRRIIACNQKNSAVISGPAAPTIATAAKNASLASLALSVSCWKIP